MNGWMEMDVRVDVWMDGDGCKGGWIDGRMSVRVGGWMDGCKGRWMDGCKGRWMDGWM